jgi:iron(III) transport system substrate-binding protein
MWKGKRSSPTWKTFLVLWSASSLGKRERVGLLSPLGATGAVVRPSSRLRIQLVTAGEALLTIAYFPTPMTIVKRAPIGWVALEPVVFNVNSISLAKRASHPNAARFSIDFLFSKELSCGCGRSATFRRAPIDPDLAGAIQRVSAARLQGSAKHFRGSPTI